MKCETPSYFYLRFIFAFLFMFFNFFFAFKLVSTLHHQFCHNSRHIFYGLLHWNLCNHSRLVGLSIFGGAGCIKI